MPRFIDWNTVSLNDWGGGYLAVTDYSYANIQNTAPYNQNIYPRGGIRELGVGGYAHLDLSGGEVGTLGLGSDATAVLSGGRIDRMGSSQWAWKYAGDPPVLVPNPHIEIICREYSYNTATKKLTGIWNVDNNKDGLFDIFNILILNDPRSSPTIENIKFTIIPEPVTVVLLAAGGLLVRRK